MKLKLFLSIICLGTIQIAFGQSPKLTKTLTEIYRADETKWTGSKREFFEYNGDLLTKYTYQQWYQLPQKFVDSRAFVYRYDDNGLLELKLEYDYTGAEEQVQNFYWDEYFYDSDGCLIALKDSVSSIHGVYTQRFFEYVNDENCNPIEVFERQLAPNGDTTLYRKFNLYNEVGLLMNDSITWWRNGEWRKQQIHNYQYDESGRMIEKQMTYYGTSFLNVEYEQWDYDDSGELIFYIRWRERPNNTDQVIYKDSIVIEYDDQNRIKRKQLYQTRFQDPSPTKYYVYDYYCEDILKLSQEDDLPRVYRTFYEYDTGFDDDCADKIENETISIFPNPSNGSFTIQGDLLGAESTIIRVFDTAGREHYSEEFSELKGQHSMELPFLKRGLYLVTVQTNKIVKTEKINIF